VRDGVVLSAERSAQTGIRLAFPGLSAARPAVVAPLAQLVDAAHRELASSYAVLSRQELAQAASLVFSEIQTVLADLRGERLEGAWRRELWDAQWQPVLALVDRALAKRLQLEASGGEPLTVCFGKRARTVAVPLPHNNQIYPYGDGCGLVHPDSVGLRRPSFRYYCPSCRQWETGRQAKARSDAVAQWQGFEPMLTFDEHGQPTPGWLGSCTRCGDDFLTTGRRVRRCDKCRSGHR
jgi:hypothetical protein